MTIEKFRMRHLKDISGWLSARGLDTKLIDELPAIGFVAYEDSLPVAAGFLRECEGGSAMADSFITDPIASKASRNAGMNLVLDAVIQEAKRLKFTTLIGFTQDENTRLRSQRHGFEESPHTIVVLNVSEAS